MENNYSIVYILIAVNVIVSLKGFSDSFFFNKYKFQMHEVVRNKEYYRIITASFLHADYFHLFFNMYTLYIFKDCMITYGFLNYLLIYFGAVILGDLLTIFLYKKDSLYSSIGASGGVSGITLAYSLIFPNIKLNLFHILPMYFWLYAVLFMVYSIYGMKKQLGNIGHSAHLGGAVAGIFGGILVFPKEILQSKAHAILFEMPTVVIMLFPVFILGIYIYKSRK